MYLIFDTETTGLPKNYKAPISDSNNWPRMVQLAWQIHDINGDIIENKNFVIKPDGYTIPYGAVKIHGISTEIAEKHGEELHTVLDEFEKAISKSQFLCGHNIEFDINVVGAEFFREKLNSDWIKNPSLDTMKLSVDFCSIPNKRGTGFKYPKLNELYKSLFGTNFEEAHNAAADVEATTRCFLELIRNNTIPSKKAGLDNEQYEAFLKNFPDGVKPAGIKFKAFKGLEEIIETVEDVHFESTPLEITQNGETEPFTHLHVHTHYSVLDGAANVKKLVARAKELKQNTLAITDHGNMFGVKDFHKTCTSMDVLPIIGSEMYITSHSRHDRDKNHKYDRCHIILLAKNREGYENLMKLNSYGYTEGYYHKPRIDKELLRKHKDGIIASSACLAGEISRKIQNETIEVAEEALLEYVDIFGEDFYIEIMRHKATKSNKPTEVFQDQTFVNKQLIALARKHNVKIIATNDVHFVKKEDDAMHDTLLCISTGSFVSDPSRMKYSGEEYLKSEVEMREIFSDIPEAINNTNEIAKKIESYTLNRAPILPFFEIPKEFENSDSYLRHLTYEGAYNRWGKDLPPETIERLDFELETIKTMGFPDYFLIVWDFLKEARKMGVSVGPGRGSAAGSAAAYSLRITEIDPIKYDLLFERFLNPDRVSMPDIDIDFDDVGRGKVLKYVVDKYGEKRVAHIITFGTLGAKSAIRDTGRVLEYPLPDTDKIAKMIPLLSKDLSKLIKDIPELKDVYEGKDKKARTVLENAIKLEGTVRSTGIHACGVIISKDDLEKYIPISNAKDSDLLYCTQYDGNHVEDIGLLKMDFLGLRNLSIIKDAVENIRLSKNVEIDIEKIPLDDEKTYQLYSRGDTAGLFQFESEGMRKHLRGLKPSEFGDLIAMNALYRPGPMEYIPDFIDRKHGRKPIKYDHPLMEKYLKETYGITVYQEQVMLLSRTLGNFTRGESDTLRKAMGKKKFDLMAKLKVKFKDGCKNNPAFMDGCKDEKIEKEADIDKLIDKIWKDWEEFAKYAFNKSHATCYSYVSYQTGYLKAHYPSQFMAALLSSHINDIAKITLQTEECNNIGIKVLGPDINESRSNFFVNSKDEIRFGMAAIKGVGESAVEELLKERDKNGPFTDIFDFLTRVNLRSVNRRSIEALTYAGAFDNFPGVHRAMFFFAEKEGGLTFIEKAIRYANKINEQKNSAQVSLFGDAMESELPPLELPVCEPWIDAIKLKREKDVIGYYVSGHPLDDYKFAVENFTTSTISYLNDNMVKMKNSEVKFAGIVTDVVHATSKKGTKYGRITVEDKNASIVLSFFKDAYAKYNYLMIPDEILLVKVKVNSRYGTEELEARPESLQQLDEAMDSWRGDIEIHTLLKNINNETVKVFIDAVNNNPGKHGFAFRVSDEKEKHDVILKGGNAKIDAPAIIDGLSHLDTIKITINK